MKELPFISKVQVSDVRKLLQRKYRTETKKFLVEGWRSVAEAIASDWVVEMVLATSEFFADPAHRELFRRVQEKRIPTIQLQSKNVKKISDTVHAQGVAAVVLQKLYSRTILDVLNRDQRRSLSGSVIVALDGVAEPGNMGTIIRTCDWFAVDALLTSTESVEIFNPKVVRSAMGSIFHLPIVSDIDLLSELERMKGRGIRVYASAVEKGEEIDKVLWHENVVIVFGNEARGVSENVMNIADKKISIPRFGKAESLNVGMACGVVLAMRRLYTPKPDS